ncbi:hypothetical protein TNCV_2161731 [Trichonephila clavipes]|nr:hypothetical protein TNCV_2161731 [Trichonephila clavipes]
MGVFQNGHYRLMSSFNPGKWIFAAEEGIFSDLRVFRCPACMRPSTGRESSLVRVYDLHFFHSERNEEKRTHSGASSEIKDWMSPWERGCGSLVVMVAYSLLECCECESGIIEVLSCRGGRCTIHLSRLNASHSCGWVERESGWVLARCALVT